MRVEPGQGLREIAAAHLGDADLWPAILRASGLTAAADAVPGTLLAIPAGEVAAADVALERAVRAIGSATAEGARLLAPLPMERSVARYRAGLMERKRGNWKAAALAADAAVRAADQARAAAAEGRDEKTLASLTDRSGRVQGRTPQDLLWQERELRSLLIEQEKVRTLSRSTAQITFRDDSRLRLGANSQAVIERMRMDGLSRREEAKVSLVEGDFYALLSGVNARRKFEVDVPAVRTTIDSRNFWVRRDAGGARFTNYDDRSLTVAAQGGAVTLGRDEGALVRDGRAPGAKVGLLPAVRLQHPADSGQTFAAVLPLRWDAAPDAVGYWLEVAGDARFDRMVDSRWGLKDAGVEIGPLGTGTYYWRVAALDRFGLPGNRGDTRRVTVRLDDTPPYLILDTPIDGQILRTRIIELRGRTEKGARMTVDGTALAADAEGAFTTTLTLRPGIEQITLEAVDAAGNRTTLPRTVRYVPDQIASIRFDEGLPRRDDGTFVSGNDGISLSGTTLPEARLSLRAGDGTLRATSASGPDGRFALTLPLAAASEELVIEVLQPSGFFSTDRLVVARDIDPPAIGLEPMPPDFTAISTLVLRGSVDDARALAVNGRPVPLVDDRFDIELELREGRNGIELAATDVVGNVSVEKLSVLLDQRPPELMNASVSEKRAGGCVPVVVEATARDSGGLRKAAAFTLRAGGTDYSDFLELEPGGQSYRKTVVLPAAMRGPLALKVIEIADYAGNITRRGFDR